MIWSRWVAFDKTWVSTGEVVQYRRRARTLSSVAAWSDGQVNLTGDGDPERVAAADVTSNIFSTLGVQPLIGRTFSEKEDVPNGPALVVLGHALWERRYNSDRDLVGRTIQINGRPFEVIGIMPNDFALPTDFQNPQTTQLWSPLQMDPASMDHGNHGLYAAARLAPGATVAQAADELRGIAAAMTKEGLYPVPMQFSTVTLSLSDEVVGTVRRSVWLLFGAVGFLLLIACANVANLLLARAEARQREIAVRSRSGCGRLARRFAASYREPGSFRPQRHRRAPARFCRRALSGVVESREHPARRERHARPARAPVHGGHGDRDERAVQHRACASCAQPGPDRFV